MKAEPTRSAATLRESPAVSTRVQVAEWRAQAGQGIELHPFIAQELRRDGYSVFSGELVRVSPGLRRGVDELQARFENLARPSFGRAGALGFFAGRQLLSFEAVLYAGECESITDADGFLGSLFKATIRVLPDYTPNRDYPLSWILSRHDTSVEDMPFHHDRVGWLVQFNIDRSPGVRGGSIRLRDGHGAVVAESSLCGFLDGYINRDALFEHGTTGIFIEPGAQEHRDVLVLRLPEQD